MRQVKYRLSQRSLDRMAGVDERLVAVVKRAIELTAIDFAVTCGVRTVAEQRRLVASGASQTMESKHVTGQAVDLMAYVGSRASWELNLYDDIAAAMQQAGKELNVPLRWGAAWNVPDITKWPGTMEAAMNHYVDARRRQGKRPFIDAPHFELA